MLELDVCLNKCFEEGVIVIYYYPQTKLWEGNVFTGVWLSTGVGVLGAKSLLGVSLVPGPFQGVGIPGGGYTKRIYQLYPHWYWHLVMTTETGSTHPTGIPSCLLKLWIKRNFKFWWLNVLPCNVETCNNFNVVNTLFNLLFNSCSFFTALAPHLDTFWDWSIPNDTKLSSCWTDKHFSI